MVSIQAGKLFQGLNYLDLKPWPFVYTFFVYSAGKRYCPMLVKEGGVELLRQMVANPKTESTVVSTLTNILSLLKEHVRDVHWALKTRYQRIFYLWEMVVIKVHLPYENGHLQSQGTKKHIKIE